MKTIEELAREKAEKKPEPPKTDELEKYRRDRLGLSRMLSSPEGKLLMDELEALYDGDTVMNPDPYITAHKLGQRSVYRMLKNLRDEARKE